MKKIFYFLMTCILSSCGPFNPQTKSNSPNASPTIKHLEWGKIIVLSDGNEYTYEDCKIWPQKTKQWNWKETDTHHVPGIQIADLQEFIDQVDVVVLSRGMHGVLQIKPETIEFLKKKNKKFYIEKTDKAVEVFNKLVGEGKKVGGVFHSTC